ncbi:MAG: GNAT family N-acetyltransferase [Anaerolineae bacterium]|nr:GNAT family N-acetyltransferase [Anaerolineae bacterium]
MQLANTSPAGPLAQPHVRLATRADAGAIQRLLRLSAYIHVHVDWHVPGDWLGTPGFVVYTREDDGDAEAIVACLAVGADPPPAAWARVAVTRSVAAFGQCEALWAAVLAGLEPDINEVAWFITDNWPLHWLDRLGFVPVSTVLGFRKDDLEPVSYSAPPGLDIRPALMEELPALAEMEAAAFEPRWRHSAQSLYLAWRQSLSFDVATLDGRPVGFQFSTGGGSSAHLARMTVDPQWQGLGVGAALMTRALEGYRRRKLRGVTLNTQEDNVVSQRLYGRFGFRPSGQKYPVWSYYPSPGDPPAANSEGARWNAGN